MLSNISSSTPGMVWPGLETNALSQRNITLRNSSTSSARNRSSLCRVLGDAFFPLADVQQAVDARAPRREDARHDVVSAEHERAVDPADDVPHHQFSHDLGVEHRGQHGVAGAARTARDDARADVEPGDQRVQCLGPHVGFALAVELHVRLAAVGPVPQQHPVAALDQRLRQRPQPRDVLAEAAARGQRDEIAFLAEDFVDDIAAVDLEDLLAALQLRALSIPVVVTPSPAHRCRRPGPGRCGCSTRA